MNKYRRRLAEIEEENKREAEKINAWGVVSRGVGNPPVYSTEMGKIPEGGVAWSRIREARQEAARLLVGMVFTAPDPETSAAARKGLDALCCIQARGPGPTEDYVYDSGGMNLAEARALRRMAATPAWKLALRPVIRWMTRRRLGAALGRLRNPGGRGLKITCFDLNRGKRVR